MVNDGLEDRIRSLKMEEGKDIWPYGGGRLFSSLLACNLVDAVELAVLPILLGGGIPFLPPAERRHLRLTGSHVYPRGMVLLEYAAEPAGQPT